MTSLESARQCFERSWGALGRALEREVGARPHRPGWSVPLLAAAVGYALGRLVSRRRRGEENRARRPGRRRG